MDHFGFLFLHSHLTVTLNLDYPPTPSGVRAKNVERYPAVDKHPIRGLGGGGGVTILLVTSCYNGQAQILFGDIFV